MQEVKQKTTDILQLRNDGWMRHFTHDFDMK